ncbi:helix-turn-helix domain-containing protein [Roseibium album]|uniref:helix-turn-helix domain-containing protein n=1 Tax=Roseibium album TaxID=311410 RepID=UPI003D9A2804
MFLSCTRVALFGGKSTLCPLERTQSGLKRAKSEGKVLWRRPSLTDSQKQDVRASLNSGMSISAVARAFGTSRQTIMRARDKPSRD